MKVYHGTDRLSAANIIKCGISLSAGRDMLDFGKGFYVSPHKGTAREWGKEKAINPNIIQYEFDVSNLKGISFKVRDVNWGIEIYNQRVKSIDESDVDYIIGPIADASIAFLVKAARNGNIKKDEFIQKVCNGTSIGCQIAIKTDKGISHLTGGKII